MRKPVPLWQFVREVNARKRAVGVSDDAIAAARNRGRRRTAEKRMQLQRIQERAQASGLEPLSAFF